MALTQTQRKHFEKLLREHRAEVEQQVLVLAGTMHEVLDARGEPSADDEHDPEGPTMTSEWSQISGVQSDALRELDRIDVALARVEDGSYGLCLRCGNQISIERLEARPAADLCIDCARLLENHR